MMETVRAYNGLSHTRLKREQSNLPPEFACHYQTANTFESYDPSAMASLTSPPDTLCLFSTDPHLFSPSPRQSCNTAYTVFNFS